ncbi:MAG: hypothetical protein M4579_002767 [Chaenotheca gracillima]|nr:MAG: hypothetical protein M4579_002767 [Chaenotheca gracillima]
MSSNRLLHVAGKLELLERPSLKLGSRSSLRNYVSRAQQRAPSSSSRSATISSASRNDRAARQQGWLSSTQLRSLRHASSAGTFSARPASTSSAPSSSPSSSAPNSDPKSDPPIQNVADGLSDEPLTLDEGSQQVDWARSFNGLGTRPFNKEIVDALLQPVTFEDVEVKPDGIIYLPEIRYRRILNKAFGPGGWGLAPRTETIVTNKMVTREYALVAHGRLVSVARGEQDYFSPEGVTTALEGCKSNAMMRCCKDLGVASELWDPRWISKFLKEKTREVFVEHAMTKKKKKIWVRQGDSPKYPFKELKGGFGAGGV